MRGREGEVLLVLMAEVARESKSVCMWDIGEECVRMGRGEGWKGAR